MLARPLIPGVGELSAVSAGASESQVRMDSLLEEAGFEPSVPRLTG
jgi:hypothetical protein